MRFVAGIDEAGRGPLAGPVTAAAVVLDPGTELHGVTDSKKLSLEHREELEPVIRARARAAAVACATPEEIDTVNILNATRLAACRALKHLTVWPEHLLLDALRLDSIDLPQQAIVKGDARCLSIAAASILAKVARDRMMAAYDRLYPGYGFAVHKGYPTPSHYAAIQSLGLTTLHRRSFFDAEFLGPAAVRKSLVYDDLAARMRREPGQARTLLAQARRHDPPLPRAELAALEETAQKFSSGR